MLRFALVIVAIAGSHARAQPVEPQPEPPPPTPFDQGKFGLGFGFGAQSLQGEHYYAVSGGAGYYVLDGLALELGTSVQFGDGPTITRLTPGVRYVVQPLVGTFPLIPYVGVFGSRYFIGEGITDENTIGARSGLLYVSGSLVLGLGAAVEHVVSECTMDCTSVYPDFTLSLSL